MNVIKLRCATLMEWGERMKQTINLAHIITMEISNENVQFSNVSNKDARTRNVQFKSSFFKKEDLHTCITPTDDTTSKINCLNILLNLWCPITYKMNQQDAGRKRLQKTFTIPYRILAIIIGTNPMV